MRIAHVVRPTAAALVVGVVSSLAVAVVGVVAAAPALAADIAARDLTITVTGLGPENRTCQVDADLYVPAGVSAAVPAPAVLATNGFGGTKADQADYAQSLGDLGYVTLSYTGLGFVTAGYEAMAGGPERLDAIIPIITWNDLSYSLAPNNTALPPGDSVSSTNAGVTKYQWALLFTTLGVGRALQDLPSATDPLAIVNYLTQTCVNFDQRVCTALTEVATQGYPSVASDSGELVVFTKLYDIAPDGTTVELPHRLISPARVPNIIRRSRSSCRGSCTASSWVTGSR